MLDEFDELKLVEVQSLLMLESEILGAIGAKIDQTEIAKRQGQPLIHFKGGVRMHTCSQMFQFRGHIPAAVVTGSAFPYFQC